MSERTAHRTFWGDVVVASGWFVYFAWAQVSIVLKDAVNEGEFPMSAVPLGASILVMLLLTLPMMLSKRWGLIVQVVLQSCLMLWFFIALSPVTVTPGQMVSFVVILYFLLRLTGTIRGFTQPLK